MQVKYIVQDLETHEFLYPSDDGFVGETPYLKQAGHFDELQDALDAGEEIGAPFQIFKFYLSE